MMSDITISRPELVNGHTDVICSTSIRHILAVRKSALLANQFIDGEIILAGSEMLRPDTALRGSGKYISTPS